METIDNRNKDGDVNTVKKKIKKQLNTVSCKQKFEKFY